MSSYAEYIVGRRSYGRITETAGTVIKRIIEPWPGARTRITGITVTTGATAHILTLLRPLNCCKFTAAAAAGQAVVNIDFNPGAFDTEGTCAVANNLLAANDYVVYEAADGTYVVDTVASIATLAVTLTTNVPTGGVVAGGRLWHFGIVTDTNPNNNIAHSRYTLAASTTTFLGKSDGLTSIPAHKYLPNLDRGLGHPLVLVIDNGTNASTLESVGVEYYRPGVAA